jgi:acetyl/propionyl-CoA carboxylase alpha subunit
MTIVRIDGKAVPPASGDIVETEPGVYSVLVDGASYEVRIQEHQISIGEHRFHYQIDDPRQWKRSGGAAGAHGRASIVAPMPGKVVRVLVAIDDAVVAGQGIVVVEAMKMQNELKAPRDGRVTAIHVAEHDGVNAGAVLAVIE